MARRILLRAELLQSCRRRPIMILLTELNSAAPGEEVVVEGEDPFYPYRRVREIVETEGFTIVEEEFDGLEYTIRAVKQGGTGQ